MNIEHHLQAQPLFDALSPEQMHQACKNAKWLLLKRNRKLYAQNDQNECFYYLAEGQVKLTLQSPAGEEKILDIIGSGDFLAEAAIFCPDGRYPTDAITMKHSRLIQIDAAQFLTVIQRSSKTCLALLNRMSHRMSGLVNEIYSLTLSDATCRIAGYLLQQNPEGGQAFELIAPKIALASRLSVKPETFSRIIRQFSNNNLIEINNKQVRIIDPKSLQMLTESCTRHEACRHYSVRLNP